MRVVERDGEPWFVLADVCLVLDLGNPSRVASRIPISERHTLTTGKGITDPRVQALTIINEPGLYRVIFTSRKPEAEAFKDWVVGVVYVASASST